VLEGYRGVEAKRVAIGGTPKPVGQKQLYPNRSGPNGVKLNLTAVPTSEKGCWAWSMVKESGCLFGERFSIW